MQKIALELPAYGYRRITAELQKQGFAINHKRVLRMMREDNLLCVRRRKFVVTTDSRHNLPIYPNLAAEIVPTAINAACGAAPAPIPDPEVPAKPKRRQFSADYKRSILDQAEACRDEGAIGAAAKACTRPT